MTESNKKYHISRKSLLLIATIVWLIAGINVIIVGIKTWQTVDTLSLPIKLLYATIVLAFFIFCIFKPIHKKYVERIKNLPNKNHPFSVFNYKGWLIMFFMIGLGVSIRKFALAPDSFIATFYCGLGTALTYTGILFFKSWKEYY